MPEKTKSNIGIFFSHLTKILLFANIFFLQSYLIKFKIFSYPTNLQEILIASTALSFFIESVFLKNVLEKIKNFYKHKTITIFVLLTAISVLTVDPLNYLYFIRYLKFFVFAIAFVYLFLETFKTTEEKISAIKFGGFGAIFFGIFSVIYNSLGYNVAYDLRLLGPLDAAVYLAYYMTPFFIFFVLEFIKNTKSKTNLISSILLLILILATRSAGAILGSFLVISFYVLNNSEIKILRSKATKIALTMIGIIVIVGVFYTKILPAFQTNYSSLNERQEIWKTSLHLAKEPSTLLFGLGQGQFQEYYLQTADKVLGHKPLDYYVLQPHNIFFLFIFQYGVLGLLFITICIYRVLKKTFLSENSTDKTSPLIFTFILLYFLLHGMIDTPFFKNDMLILFILFMELGLQKQKA
ncbi:O-antigen ligase family protein [Candidatus Gracilibacteria bacterium]|nr:O-antigen ligase family protein [Candidatus Gracilibacteria bacterium]